MIIVTGGWSGALMVLATYLHQTRVKQIQRLSDRIDAAETRAAMDHKALALQMVDTNRTIAEHYVRREDQAAAMRDLKEDMAGVIRAVSENTRRIDQFYQYRPRT
jgi:hypothetical protein